MHLTYARHTGHVTAGLLLTAVLFSGCSMVSGPQPVHQSAKGAVYLEEVSEWSFEADHPTMIDQTTMLKSETEEIQNRVRAALLTRDGNAENFHVFDTICGATQERQDALFEMLKEPMDLMIVVGGYNSSNTTHLVEIAEQNLPTFFIHSAQCIRSLEEIVHYDIHKKEEVTSRYAELFDPAKPVTIGITAGASCPNNLIEDTILKILELRGIPADQLAKDTAHD